MNAVNQVVKRAETAEFPLLFKASQIMLAIPGGPRKTHRINHMRRKTARDQCKWIQWLARQIVKQTETENDDNERRDNHP